MSAALAPSDDALQSRIAALCEAARVPLDAARHRQLARYLELLSQWNRVYNLTAVRQPDDMLRLHLADCLAVVPHFMQALAALKTSVPPAVSSDLSILDVGSGGGLPAVVLAIAMPQVAVTACDRVAKKCAFMQQVQADLGLANLHVVHARVEQLHGHYALITSRAFSELQVLVQSTVHLLQPGGTWLAMKGAAPTDELNALRAAQPQLQANVLPVQVPGLDAQRCLVRITREATA